MTSPGLGTAIRSLPGWKSSQECDDGGVLGPGSTPEHLDSHERDQGHDGDSNQQREGQGYDGGDDLQRDGEGGQVQRDGVWEIVQGDRDVVEEAEGQEDGHHDGAPGVSDVQVLKHLSQVKSRKPKPMFFKRKRGIVPDGLVQMRLSNFIKTFPNLQPSGAVTMGGRFDQ